MFGLYKF